MLLLVVHPLPLLSLSLSLFPSIHLVFIVCCAHPCSIDDCYSSTACLFVCSSQFCECIVHHRTVCHCHLMG
jgi:hypothetical protein